MDLINRQDAIDLIKGKINDVPHKANGLYKIDDGMYVSGLNRAKELITFMKPAQQWIPCSERLPEKEGQYLVTLDFSWGKEIEMGDWFNGEWVNPNSHVTVAWMEPPEPWKESEEE